MAESGKTAQGGTRVGKEDGGINVCGLNRKFWISGTFQVLLDKDGSYADVGREKENLLFYEVPAAMFYLNLSVRDVLNRMIRWYICLKNKEPVELGILDSYLERYLPEEIWAGYSQTYACAEQASLWNALDEMAELFHRAGVEVAAEINTAFPDRQQRNDGQGI